MENNQELIKTKIEQLFSNALQTLEKSTESELTCIEHIKYDFYDNCYIVFKKLAVEEASEHIETSNAKKPTKKEEDNKKPLKTEETRSRTPSKLVNSVRAKPKEKEKEKEKEKTNELFKLHEKPNEFQKTHEKKMKSSLNLRMEEEPRKSTIKNNQTTTKPPPVKRVMRKSNTVILKKKPLLKTDNKAAGIKTTRGFNQKENEAKKKNDEANDLPKEEIIQNCITNIAIIPQLIPKYTYLIPNDIKGNNLISMLFILSKSDFLKPKEKYSLIVSSPLLFKAGYKSTLSFFLEGKIAKLKAQIGSIETLFSSYGDINTYLSKTFSPSKTAQNSLTFVTAEEEINLSKKEDLPIEIGIIFKIVYIIIDEPIEESFSINQLIPNLFNVVLPKFDVKDLRSLLLSYANNKRTLLITKEKYDKIGQIIKDNPKILSSIDIAKINRPISYVTFFLKEIYDFMGLKTLDGVFYFELRNKSNELKELKGQLEKLKSPTSESNSN